jgi:hypothetical protein
MSLKIVRPNEAAINRSLAFSKANNRVVSKLRKTQHQNPQFGRTQGEIKKKPAK